MTATGSERDHEKPHEDASHREDVGEVEDGEPRHRQIVDDLTRERRIRRCPEHPVDHISQAACQHHRKENSIHHVTAPHLDRHPSGQRSQHTDQDDRHDRAETRTHAECDTRVEDQPQIERRKYFNDAAVREITERPLLHELIEDHTGRHHQKHEQAADKATSDKVGSNITHPTTIQKFLNYLSYSVLMTTKWNAPALTARLRLLRVLNAAPTDSTVASTKLRLVTIADQVDQGALRPEHAERLLIGLTDHLERRGSHK